MPASAQSVSIAFIPVAIGAGWRDFKARPGLSMAYTAVFLSIGMVLLSGVMLAGLTPMVWPLVGAFMLFGPLAMAGFMTIQAAAPERPATLATALHAVIHAGRALWVMGGFCMLMTLVWLTDAATLYAFMIGSFDTAGPGSAVQAAHLPFHGGASVMGAALALIVYVVTVHGVPLMVAGEPALVTSITASVRGVGASMIAHLLWAFVLAASVMAAILLLPALLVVLPVAAYASRYWTRAVYPGAV